MAELALSALAAAGASSAGAATSAAAWAAGTTITTAAGASSALLASSGVLGTLSTVATIGSSVATLLGGALGYRQAQQQADVAEMNASAAETEAAERSYRIRRELVQKVGQARVAFAGSGLDISSGDAIEAGYRREADFETSLAKSAGQIGAASGRATAETYRTRGYSSLVEAAARASGSLVSERISIARRG